MNDITRLFSGARQERLAALGHDFLEEKCTGSSITDHEGRKYIDCVSGRGIYNLGRHNQALSRALTEAVMKTDQGNFPMISIEKARLAEKLARFIGHGLECSVFSVIRGESIDFACKLARGYTKRKKFVTFKGSWFGQTGFALSLSERDDASLYGPLVPSIEMITPGSIEEAEKTIDKETAAVFIEPVQAENGCLSPDKDYFKALRRLCSSRGALLIFDETQTGMGRCGSAFAFQELDVTPDVLVIGESLGGGIFPIAATIFTQKINGFMNAHPMIHLSTFGGADQGCLVACAALDEYEKVKPWENARRQGEVLLKGLKGLALQEGSPLKSAAGTGLLIALELENAEKATDFCRALAGAGLIALPGDVAKETVVLRPGLLINDDDCANIISAVKNALKTLV